jgi:hypothetical protein
MMIGPVGLLLVVSHLFAVTAVPVFSVLYGGWGLQKSKTTKLAWDVKNKIFLLLRVTY